MPLKAERSTAPALLLLFFMTLAGCGSNGTSQRVTIGREGKQVILDDGSTLTVPPNALVAPVRITFSRRMGPPPSEGSADEQRTAEEEATSVWYQIEPYGIQFHIPATLSLAAPAGARTSEGWALSFSPDASSPPMSLGRSQDPDLVVAEINYTGMASVQAETGIRTVLGSAKLIHYLADGSITHTNQRVELLKLLFRDAYGVKQERWTELAADGTFRFDDVPTGKYQFQYGSLGPSGPTIWGIIETDASMLDLGETTLIRPTATPASAGTSLSFTITDPVEPSASDLFYLHGSSVGYWATSRWVDAESYDSPLELGGSLTGRYLLNGEEGDVLTVSRLAAHSISSNAVYFAARDRAHVEINQEDGKESVVDLKLKSYPYSRRVWFTVKTPDFLADPDLPGGAACEPYLQVDVESYPEFDHALSPTTELAGPNQQLLNYQRHRPEGTIHTGVMTYGSDTAKPESESVYLSAMSLIFDGILLPGTWRGPDRVCGFSGRNGIPLGESADPLWFKLSPPRSLTVNGQPATTSIVEVPAAPLTLEWEAPALGAPNVYTVQLNSLRVQDSQTYVATRTPLRTRDTRITVPQDLIEPGASYFIRIQADSLPKGSLQGAFRYPAGESFSFADSGIIRIAD